MKYIQEEEGQVISVRIEDDLCEITLGFCLRLSTNRWWCSCVCDGKNERIFLQGRKRVSEAKNAIPPSILFCGQNQI